MISDCTVEHSLWWLWKWVSTLVQQHLCLQRSYVCVHGIHLCVCVCVCDTTQIWQTMLAETSTTLVPATYVFSPVSSSSRPPPFLSSSRSDASRPSPPSFHHRLCLSFPLQNARIKLLLYACGCTFVCHDVLVPETVCVYAFADRNCEAFGILWSEAKD